MSSGPAPGRGLVRVSVDQGDNGLDKHCDRDKRRRRDFDLKGEPDSVFSFQPSLV